MSTQVRDRDEERREEGDTHHGGEVVQEDAPHRVLADARQTEDGLRDERPAEQDGQIEPEHRHDRRQRGT